MGRGRSKFDMRDVLLARSDFAHGKGVGFDGSRRRITFRAKMNSGRGAMGIGLAAAMAGGFGNRRRCGVIISFIKIFGEGNRSRVSSGRRFNEVGNTTVVFPFIHRRVTGVTLGNKLKGIVLPPIGFVGVGHGN